MTIFLIALINAFSAFIQAASGLGYAIFAMFFMPMIIPFQQCSVISAAVIVVIGIQMTISLHSHIKFKKIIIPMAFCLMTTWVGIYIIRVTDAHKMRIIMGIFLILLTIYFYITNKFNIRMRAGLATDVTIGLLTGLTTGMFNIVGPLLSLYYYDNCEDSLEFKANIEFSFLIAGIYSLSLNLIYVKLDPFLIKAIGFSAIGTIFAGIIGLHLFKKIDKTKLKYVIIGVLPIMGLILIFK
ncbi:MAG TPA: sulfite exporter TauE/SafE family protein [Patescibacteria group bacterium]|nr:sulfite exporter TauE/SafE family protein [Patescibacteria group bacterium]